MNRGARNVPTDAAVPLLRAIVWIAIAMAAIPTRTDPDLWGSLRFGLDMLASGHVVTVDRYSFTADLPWVNHDWLFQLLIAIVYRGLGSVGLVALKAAIVLLTIAIVRRQLIDLPGLRGDLVAALCMWAALPLAGTVRAQLFSWWFLASIPFVVRRRRLAFLFTPLLFALWVNLHIGWIVGFGVLTVCLMGEMRVTATRYRALALFALAALATVASPYGWRQWSFVLQMSHVSRDISEWQPLWHSPVVNWIPWLIAASLAVIAVRRIPAERMALLLALAYVSLRALKFTPFFVECVVMLLPWRATISSRLPVARLPIGFIALNSAAAAIVAIAAGQAVLPYAGCLRMGTWRPDPIAAASLIDAKPIGRIVPQFDWGEYIIWHLGPDLRVSFDPRYDLMYSAQAIGEQRAVAEGMEAGRAFVRRTHPEYFWFPQQNRELKSLLIQEGYRIDIDTEESFVAVRHELSRVPLVAPESSARCFPRP